MVRRELWELEKTAWRWPGLTLVCFVNSYPVESYFSNGWRYPPFEQLPPSVSPSNYHESVSSSRKVSHHREHTLLLSWKRVNKGMNRLPLSPVAISYATCISL